ncbi:MAG: endonuclease MutS2 [Nitrospirota bacterium]
MISQSCLELLEFHKLLRLISDLANSEASRLEALDIHPLNERHDIETRQSLISEFRKLAHEGAPLRLSHFSDITPHIGRIRPEGAILEAKELADFVPVLSIASAVSLQLIEREDLPFLKEAAKDLTGFPDILRTLQKSIDSEGNILDTASFLLADLRSRIRKLEFKIRKKLEEIVRDERISTFLQDDFVTQRSGRWVIPVRMDSKGQVPGVVHDVSKSGETAFVEPLAIINLANELENVIAEQKAEEIRILRRICSDLRAVIDRIESEFRTIVYMDVLSCIAKFADRVGMNMPSVNRSGSVDLVQARHPLLQLAFEKRGDGRQVVPLDVQLGGDNTVMVITGANAGGKTIAIKTIGLLMLMALSGMPIPADSSSHMPLIRNLLADIGDEQSIEDNLSTFSAHVSNISEILEETDTDAVILLDELGTGTDPEEGAALACAILKDIRKSGALAFATTHLSEIKGFVHRTEGMLNASMEFDRKTLNPLYRLRIGEPGQSHALDIARRYGLPDRIVSDAQDMLGNIKVEFDNLIADLEEKRSRYEKGLEDLRKQQSDVLEKNRKLEQILSESKMKHREMLAQAYKEAADIISKTRRQMHGFLDELKKKGRTESRRVLKQVDIQAKQVEERIRQFEPDTAAPSIEDLKTGDVIFVRSLHSDASIVDINTKTGRLKVASRNMEIEVPVSDIRMKKGTAQIPAREPVRIPEAEEIVPLKLNLVGMRVDEAISKLERFLNDVSLADLREVVIIHGIGKGLLMKAVHEHLNEHPLVKHYRGGTIEEGGVGVTIVTMK